MLHFFLTTNDCFLQDPPMVLAQQPVGAPGVVVSHSSIQFGRAAYLPGANGPAYPLGTPGQAMYPEQTVASHDKAPLVV